MSPFVDVSADDALSTFVQMGPIRRVHDKGLHDQLDAAFAKLQRPELSLGKGLHIDIKIPK